MVKNNNCAILVLGDLNRSPRMLNHCRAISENMPEINEISLIGFHGGDIRSDIANDKKIKLYHIPEKFNNYLKKLPRFLFLFSALIRILLQVIFLFYILLFKIPKPKFLILQNPPGIPAIYICSVVCFLRRSTFIIDWHNYGFTILQVNKRNKIICFLAKMFEKIYGRCAHLHFCVSEAMREHLRHLIGIDAINLPDRAMKGVFRRMSLDESHLVFQKYPETKDLITRANDFGKIEYIPNRPLVMISSTSWTPDEDFEMLLNSFKITESSIVTANDYEGLRKVLFIITGRGPMKDTFMNKIAQSRLKLFDVRSVWLESDDYPRLLGSVDLGVCLHYSSSGYDLPMKVVDMFSSALPVCAVYYPTIRELVKENQNGYLFNGEEDLAELLKKIIIEFSQNGQCQKLEEFRADLLSFNQNDWVSQWKNNVRDPILRKSKIKSD